jgi:hypothetical protein
MNSISNGNILVDFNYNFLPPVERTKSKQETI